MNVIEKVQTISLTTFDMMQNLLKSSCVRYSAVLQNNHV